MFDLATFSGTAFYSVMTGMVSVESAGAYYAYELMDAAGEMT